MSELMNVTSRNKKVGPTHRQTLTASVKPLSRNDIDVDRKKHKRIIRSVRSRGKEKLSSFIRPMLATLHDEIFDDPNWIYEIKWDGYRAVAEIKSGNVKLYSRNGLSFLNLYPRVARALEKIKSDAVFDGEIVVLNRSNKPDFQKLQQYSEHQSLPIIYYVFDCLQVKGKSVTHLPLLERKRIARKIITPNDPIIKYSDHVIGDGKKLFSEASKMDLEGLIAKRADSPYDIGKRSKDWLKIKNHNTQEAIIVGYTPPKGSRTLIGALVLAIKEKNNFKYIGHTGTGFSNETLKQLHAKLEPLKRESSPFDHKIRLNSLVTWVEPVLVCNVKYTEITSDGILRHPVFQGLRVDKTASEVTSLDKPVDAKTTVAPSQPKNQTANRSAKGKEMVVIDGRELTLTNQGKIYWPEEKITKGEVLNYYNNIHKLILPYLKDRPQSLKRTPNGILNPGFFQKNADESFPEWMKTIPLRAESANRTVNYILCNDLATLLYLNNLGCIEINPWHSRAQKLDHPDYLVFDLDPSDKNTFDQVIETALVINDILSSIGAAGYCKTSGASGLHVYVPLHGLYTYDEALPFAEKVMQAAQRQLPATTTLERTISKRNDKLYLDYLQNRKAQTVSSVYSLRPKPGAPVSTPLQWKELKPGLHPKQYNIHNLSRRLSKVGDLFSGVLSEKINLKKCLKLIETKI
jgi:bifunctional non-homologous end joining protein LigD